MVVDERIKFWNLKERWPKDTAEFVFLGNVLDRVGRNTFPLEWTGEESTTPEPFNFSQQFGTTQLPLSLTFAKEWQKGKVFTLLQAEGVDVPEYNSGSRYQPPQLVFSREQWTRGVKLAIATDEKNRPALNRWAKVIDIVSEKFAAGLLVSVLRPVAGGAFTEPLDKELWNSERLYPRFYWCQLNPSDPFGNGVGGKGYQYIFATQASLNSFLNPELPKAKSQPKGRPAAYDWAAFETKALDVLDFRGAIDPTIDPSWTQSHLEQEMAVWAKAQWGKEPSESTIRGKLSSIITAHKEGRK